MLYNILKSKNKFIFIIAFIAILITVNFALPTYKLMTSIGNTLQKRQGNGGTGGGTGTAPETTSTAPTTTSTTPAEVTTTSQTSSPGQPTNTATPPEESSSAAPSASESAGATAAPQPTELPPEGPPPPGPDLGSWVVVGANSTLHCRDGIMRRQDGNKLPDANCGTWL